MRGAKIARLREAGREHPDQRENRLRLTRMLTLRVIPIIG
ncbi:hypothetical protein MPLDJ20_70252 [Mesorhizobium plurifarium]|uniref:Uncharacterized protein n=1 Tax=Mesorhizobium plurifarium TaxID=69974 RepID=A0A090FNU5_MESPL|nr:hypothetical protein MPLDJ20_70252 [Mesorhizobium plurifarium]